LVQLVDNQCGPWYYDIVGDRLGARPQLEMLDNYRTSDILVVRLAEEFPMKTKVKFIGDYAVMFERVPSMDTPWVVITDYGYDRDRVRFDNYRNAQAWYKSECNRLKNFAR
jgi:hypothetical protein